MARSRKIIVTACPEEERDLKVPLRLGARSERAGRLPVWRDRQRIMTGLTRPVTRGHDQKRVRLPTGHQVPPARRRD